MTDDKGGKKISRERNNADSLDALRMVINENQGLKLRILRKIKLHLSLKDQTIFDVGRDGKNTKKGDDEPKS